MDSSGHAAFKGISLKAAAVAFDLGISLAVMGVVGGIQKFILKKGAAEAAKIFTKTIVSKLIALGAPRLASFAGAAVGYALGYYSIGTTVAKELDKRDSIPNNGYLW